MFTTLHSEDTEYSADSVEWLTHYDAATDPPVAAFADHLDYVRGSSTDGRQSGNRRAYVEYLLICSFLARARLRRIRGALNWIQNVVA